ncbi:tetratricopeptide repeat-containing sensor histidine kinase [Psychroflexus planctonicus]|uniref:histidine kinase n=1 Tax=Psychroflexus planctonicus TaxID=1526575 RepID=A0ABQ1SCP1_9FLAO|nr:sensor histidine kinase [Psychroflexus planctonicus]GGE27830.1 hypothetical protein GCM10010832_05700 [Psychroflexus planctonicus]
MHLFKKHTLLFFCFWISLGFSQEINIDSLKQVINTDQDTEKAKALFQLTNFYRRQDSILYKKYLEEGLSLATKTGNKENALKLAYLECKWLYFIKRDYKEVIKKTDSLVPLAKELGMKELQAELHNYSGSAYGAISEYPKAVVEFLEFLKVANTLEDDPSLIADAGNNVGMAFLNMKLHDQAISYLNNSLEYQKKYDSRIKAHTYWNLGICYMAKKDYDLALEIFKKGVNEAQRVDDQYAAAGNQLCIGAINLRKEDFEAAIVEYTKAYEMSIKASLEPFKLIEALNGLIYAHNQINQPEKGYDFVKIADSITSHHELTDLRNREFLFYKASNLMQLGKPREADQILKRYNIARDSLQSAKNIEIIQAKETEFRTQEKEQQLKLQEAKLDFQKILITLLATGVFLIMLIAFMVYRQQRLKIKQQAQERELKEALVTMETNKKLEEQRMRISRELHDNIGSQLTYLVSAVQNIGYNMEKASKSETWGKLQKLSEFSQHAISDLRDTIWVMNHNLINLDHLSERLNNLAHKVSNLTQIEVSVKLTGHNELHLDPVQTLSLYRIIQEAVNNAVKHSQAKHIYIHLDISDSISVEIRDDGQGYNPEMLTSDGNGLLNMKSRANALGTELQITSNSAGTSVKLEFQVKRNVA